MKAGGRTVKNSNDPRKKAVAGRFDERISSRATN
jgi:hypothetical protein